MKTQFYSLLLLVPFMSCGGNQNTAQDPVEKPQIVSDTPAEVSVMALKHENFSYDLISNGIVSAKNSAEMIFQSQELIRAIYVKNGQKVAKGQKLAELDKFKLENSFAQAEEALERAKLELQDVLIGQGYSINSSDSIPAEVLKIAKIRSNYEQADNNYKLAKHNLDAATLYAPFAGVIANLTCKVYNLPGNDAFCSVVDNNNMEVVFHILEGELPHVGIGDKLAVSAFSAPDMEISGKVTEINPVVGKNGMVRIVGEIRNASTLYDGMNVKVRAERLLGRKLVVPKSAVVLRTNKQVVFTMKNGKAYWNYVTTAQENSSGFVIAEGLNAGDSVIYEGNLNLAHESPVVLKN